MVHLVYILNILLLLDIYTMEELVVGDSRHVKHVAGQHGQRRQSEGNVIQFGESGSERRLVIFIYLVLLQGCGGCGGSNYLISSALVGVDFLACRQDALQLRTDFFLLAALFRGRGTLARHACVPVSISSLHLLNKLGLIFDPVDKGLELDTDWRSWSRVLLLLLGDMLSGRSILMVARVDHGLADSLVVRLRLFASVQRGVRISGSVLGHVDLGLDGLLIDFAVLDEAAVVGVSLHHLLVGAFGGKLNQLSVLGENHDRDLAVAEHGEFHGLLEQTILSLAKSDGASSLVFNSPNLDFALARVLGNRELLDASRRAGQPRSVVGRGWLVVMLLLLLLVLRYDAWLGMFCGERDAVVAANIHG